MSTLTTWTGHQINPVKLRAEDVDIVDIAHALSMICRFNGHCARFYSVAEHSVLVSRLCPPSFARAGLLHDATEAYIADIPRPLKEKLPDYVVAEQVAERVMSEHFGVPEMMPDLVRQADDEALRIEMAAILVVRGTTSLDQRVRCLTPPQACEEFLARFRELSA